LVLLACRVAAALLAGACNEMNLPASVTETTIKPFDGGRLCWSFQFHDSGDPFFSLPATLALHSRNHFRNALGVCHGLIGTKCGQVRQPKQAGRRRP
jgi:hypothetical protein